MKQEGRLFEKVRDANVKELWAIVKRISINRRMGRCGYKEKGRPHHRS